jgi:hypothetical protein
MSKGMPLRGGCIGACSRYAFCDQKVSYFWLDGRLHGSYPEPAFEDVIEANRRFTWTINAVTGKVDSDQKHLSDYATNRELADRRLKRKPLSMFGYASGTYK